MVYMKLIILWIVATCASSHLIINVNVTTIELVARNRPSQNKITESVLTINLQTIAKQKIPNLKLTEALAAPRTILPYFKYLLSDENVSLANIEIEESKQNCWKITSTAILSKTNKHGVTLEDCISLKTKPAAENCVWYGGAELFSSHFASTAQNGSSFPMQPFISSDIFASETKLGGVLDAKWFNSDGWSISVPSASVQSVQEKAPVHFPLWASFRDSSEAYRSSSLCFRSSYRNITNNIDSQNKLQYEICAENDVLEVWKKSHDEIHYKESSPNITMLERPIWSTWAEYKVFINQSAVLDYAAKIVENGYQHSVLEIDDRWSSAYGDFTFDPVKFPAPLEMIQRLHSWNFSVMLWVTPFCDFSADAYAIGIQHHYFVMKFDSENKSASNNYNMQLIIMIMIIIITTTMIPKIMIILGVDKE